MIKSAFVVIHPYQNAVCGRPVRAIMQAIKPVMATPIAASMPKGCALNAGIILPLTVYENAVVIPQVGHGISAAMIHPQLGRPNCSWVPTPSSDGESHAAVARTTIDTNPTANAASRLDRVDGIELEHALCVSCSIRPHRIPILHREGPGNWECADDQLRGVLKSPR